jgi:multicopper oxidase
MPALSRRRFLSLSAGLTAAPLLFSGCRKSVVDGGGTRPGPEPNYVLRASRFSLAPDGHERQVWGYNGQLPGPTLRAKFGETLRIKVVNELAAPTTIHWHGMHQPGTWRMDGVENISQVPISPGGEFLYEYKAMPAGTHWYHSHVGVQYGDGLFGPLIVEDPTPIAIYDREETLLINDWFWELGDDILARLVKGGMGKMPMKDMKEMKDKPDVGDVPFRSGLINGKGRPKGVTKGPLTIIDVKKGETLRLRLINGSSTYMLRFQVDGHPLTVIASDGQPMKPVTVDNLKLDVGETYDVLLKADQDGVHWIRAVTLDGNPILAVLRYAGSSAAEPEASPVHWGPRTLTPEEMRSRAPVALAEKPREIPLTLGGTMKPYRWNINAEFFPDAKPIDIAKDEPIRFILRNPTMMDHPFHLHGHSFHVLGKPDALNLEDPAFKDTVSVPAKSDLVLQWVANNPGRWFWHCHIEWHLATGMARILEIKPY